MGARALAAAVVLLAGSASAATSTISGLGSIPLTTGNALGTGRPCRQAFRVLPYLTHMTSTSVRINMIPEDSFDLRVTLALPKETWGVAGSGVTAQVTQAAATADTRTHLVAAPAQTFTGLTAGTDYKYLVECRAAGSGADWKPVSQAWFRTLETNTAATTRAIIVGDDHTVGVWNLMNCADVNGIGPPSLSGRTLNRYASLQQAIINMTEWSAQYLVMAGDSALASHGEGVTDTNFPLNGKTECHYRFENGVAFPIVLDADNDAQGATTADALWEIYLSTWQPLIQAVPLFQIQGNHEGIFGFGGVGGAQICGLSQNEASRNLTSMQSMIGNFNDVYPNGSTADLDGDTVVENQEDGIYYEFASGSMRWFMTDNMRYGIDDCSGGACTDTAGIEALTRNAVPAIPFVARTADTPAAVFGTVPSATFNLSGDTYEDNGTMGATESAWLGARANAKTETFGAIVSHRILGGINPGACYWYTRGLLLACDQNGDGWRNQASESLDVDCDGDVSDEKYILDLMVQEGIQMRVVGHDHFMQICRRNTRHYMEIGQPSCSSDAPLTTAGNVGGACTPNWILTTRLQDSTNQQSKFAYFQTYDCNGDGKVDADPLGGNDATVPTALSNEGLSGTNATLNRGFGLLTVNGTTNMTYRWIVRDPWDPVRDNDVIITYGPINP